jgi:hypothetical protein
MSTPTTANLGISTRGYNAQRTNATLTETSLTQAAVRTRGLTSYYSFNFEGDARGTEAATLIAPNLLACDGLTHNLAFCVTMANDVYGFDCDTGGLLWMRRIGNAIVNTRAIDMYEINDHWGILSTPVINPRTNIGYCVAMISPDGTVGNSKHWLYAINLADGSNAAPPLDLSTASYTAPTGRVSVMGAVTRKQRCALLLDSRNGIDTVFVANGSFMESADTNQGWLIACDVTTDLQLAAAWTSTNRYSGGGIWQGAGGPTLDPSTGDVLLAIGNGAFDGITDFGESVVRIGYTPAAGNTPAALAVKQWFTPYTDTGRVAGAMYQTVADLSLLPAAEAGDDDPAMATSNMDSSSDEDLNSGGPCLILASQSGLSRDIIVQSGKDGILYVINADHMGSPPLSAFAPETIQAEVYALLLSPPYWFTYYNPQTPAPTDLSLIDTTYAGKTHHMHATPVFFRSAVHGPMLFCMGENGNLRAFAINSDFTLTYLACSAEVASADCTMPPGGMPGGMLSLSANGSVPGTAIIWACIPYGDANKSITQGRFIAYDAENFGTYSDGSGAIRKLWDSQAVALTYTHNKFNIAHVFNGKIFLPTYSGSVIVLQLA